MLLENYLFLDIEASGLHPDSYPIQIGIAWPNMSIDSQQFLIRPVKEWTYWSREAEAVHGFSLDECRRDGVTVIEAVERLESLVAGRFVHSDVVAWDDFWLNQLYAAAGRERSFALHDVWDAYGAAVHSLGHVVDPYHLCSQCLEWASRPYPHTHKADDDARFQAAAMRAIVDSEFRNEIKRQYELATSMRQR